MLQHPRGDETSSLSRRRGEACWATFAKLSVDHLSCWNRIEAARMRQSGAAATASQALRIFHTKGIHITLPKSGWVGWRTGHGLAGSRQACASANRCWCLWCLVCMSVITRYRRCTRAW